MSHLRSFYTFYNPEKLPSVASVRSRYVGREATLLDELYQKYNVPVPPAVKKKQAEFLQLDAAMSKPGSSYDVLGVGIDNGGSGGGGGGGGGSGGGGGGGAANGARRNAKASPSLGNDDSFFAHSSRSTMLEQAAQERKTSFQLRVKKAQALRFQNADVLMEGYLEKCSEWVKKWNARWFVLRGSTLAYFTNATEAAVRNAHPKGFYDFDRDTRLKSGSDRDPTTFTIVFYSRPPSGAENQEAKVEVVNLAATSASAKRAWVQAVSECIRHVQRRVAHADMLGGSTSTPTSARDRVALPAPQQPNTTASSSERTAATVAPAPAPAPPAPSPAPASTVQPAAAAQTGPNSTTATAGAGAGGGAQQQSTTKPVAPAAAMRAQAAARGRRAFDSLHRRGSPSKRGIRGSDQGTDLEDLSSAGWSVQAFIEQLLTNPNSQPGRELGEFVTQFQVGIFETAADAVVENVRNAVASVHDQLVDSALDLDDEQEYQAYIAVLRCVFSTCVTQLVVGVAASCAAQDAEMIGRVVWLRSNFSAARLARWCGMSWVGLDGGDRDDYAPIYDGADPDHSGGSGGGGGGGEQRAGVECEWLTQIELLNAAYAMQLSPVEQTFLLSKTMSSTSEHLKRTRNLTTIGADDLIPSFTFVVLMSDWQQPYTMLRILKGVLDSRRMRGETMWAVVSFEASCYFIQHTLFNKACAAAEADAAAFDAQEHAAAAAAAAAAAVMMSGGL